MTNTRTREVRVFPGLEGLSEAAAAEIADVARASIAERGRFSIALSGGNTPKRTYELLAQSYSDSIDWNRVDVFFGDERFVPPDDKRSNYKMARDTLLSAAPILADHVHPIPTDTRTVGDAADLYARTLENVLNGQPAGSSVIDLVLLGVGPDGHTASLFPGSPALDERARWASAVEAPTTVLPSVPRVTLTLPFLNTARTVLFLVAGADKRPVMGEILSNAESAARRYPAAMVAPAGRTLWMIEQAAMPGASADT